MGEMRIHLHPPDGAPEEATSLLPGDALLVGRAPDRVAAASTLAGPAVNRELSLASARVSSNHLLLWRTGDTLCARDLASKNGTFVRLEPDAVASMAGVGDAHFFLAAPRPATPGVSLSDVPIVDATPEAFADRLRGIVLSWLAQSGLSSGLSVVVSDARRAHGAVPGPPPQDDTRFSLPLVDGLALEIEDTDPGRTEVRWDGLKTELFPYVDEQVARWRACFAVRGRGALAFGSPGAARALREVLEAGRLRVPLMLRGESGTGKTALAAIYARRESSRPGRAGPLAGSEGGPPFVTVHCAHLDAALAHATLFGAMKGSYTSAERTLLGAVKLADGGVLFLDDVDALPPETQAKLLRFLDEGRYEPLGHGQREPLVAHVRVVASTNVDLRPAVRERRFREDLYWRLHMGAVVRVPPLRERPEDIEQLFRDLPGEGAFEPAGAGRQGRSVRDRLDAAALDFLVRGHPWRGNFRECLRFCTRVRMEPAEAGPLTRRRSEGILAEASLEPEVRVAPTSVEDGKTPFERSLHQAVAWWFESEGGAPERFDELGRFCETYLKSAFVAQSLGLGDADERPESFDRDRRQSLGCDLTTLKRKVDEYVALRKDRLPPQGAGV
jgi:hypothetical protein